MGQKGAVAGGQRLQQSELISGAPAQDQTRSVRESDEEDGDEERGTNG